MFPESILKLFNPSVHDLHAQFLFQAVYEVGSIPGCSPYIRLVSTGDLYVLADAQGEGCGGEGGGGDEEGGEEGGREEGEGGRQVYQAEDQAMTPF